MITKEFAVKMKKHNETILRWLNAGIVPGARKVRCPFGWYWEIPEEALQMPLPRKGIKLGSVTAGQEQVDSKSRIAA